MFKKLLLNSVKIIFMICFLASGIYVNAQCMAWTNNAYDDGKGGYYRTNYLSFFANNCGLYTVNGNENLYCFWTNPEDACKGKIKEKEWDLMNPNHKGLPFEYRGLLPGKNSNVKICKYKRKDSDNIYADFSVNRVDVAEQPFESFCNTPVKGPYSNCADLGSVQRGSDFNLRQIDKVMKMNKENNGGKSDLAGVTIAGHKETENSLIGLSPTNDKRQIHHIIPPNDRQTCGCGTNSYKNAIVISPKLKGILEKLPVPPPELLEAVKKKKPYPCSN